LVVVAVVVVAVVAVVVAVVVALVVVVAVVVLVVVAVVVALVVTEVDELELHAAAGITRAAMSIVPRQIPSSLCFLIVIGYLLAFHHFL
jgi:hypothetical protein